MIASLPEVLAACVAHLPEPLRADAHTLLRPDLCERLAARLLAFHECGVVDRPEPHFVEEVTPPLAPVFEAFRQLVSDWKAGNADAGRWAEAVASVGVGGLLLLLGQRRTPASFVGIDGLPPARETLLASATAPCNPGKELTVAARAWDKHAPRSGAAFWGKVSGGDREKNAAALALIERILDDPTWWNVFGHYVHDTVFEARVASGHGARWGRSGTLFIGFLEPFENGERPA